MEAPSIPATNRADEPYFQPFEGAHYWNPIAFPSRLLILGESHYLRDPANDDRPDFTRRILESVAKDHTMRGWPTDYFRKLFFVLTGHRGRDVRQEDWSAMWNSLAFYNYVQTRELRGPRRQPTAKEWQQAQAPFRLALARLQPQLILATGKRLFGYAAQGGEKRDSSLGVWLPTSNGNYAYMEFICHPSSSRFTRDKCRSSVGKLLARNDSSRVARSGEP
jgi:hypothetical protein